MSRVPYTIDVNRYVCSELENIRTMCKTLDFSSLPATVERIQFHASAMEDGLYRYEGIKYELVNKVSDEKVTDEEFRKAALEVLGKLKNRD